MNIPQKLIIVDGAMAMDGGSISLMGKDPSGNIIQISLDWSLDDQINRTTKLSLGGMTLKKRSPEEAKLLEVLNNAEIQVSEASNQTASTPTRRVSLAEDIHKYLSAIEDGPEAGLRRLINQLISNVMSEKYIQTVPGDTPVEKPRNFDGPCSFCGKPGYVQALPGVPVSDIRCDDCAQIRTFNPISILMSGLTYLFLGLLICLIIFLISKLF